MPQSAALRRLLTRKIHLLPAALRHSPASIRDQLPSAWHAAVRLSALLAGLPDGALAWWADQSPGHIVLTERDTGHRHLFDAGSQGTLQSVALIPLSTLVDRPRQALALALHPLDHLLGCGGEPAGRWLSDGGGLNRRWSDVGGQIARLYALGYGLSAAGRAHPHIYLAEGLAAALHDRPVLNRADPKLDRLLASTLLSPGFWRNSLPGQENRPG